MPVDTEVKREAEVVRQVRESDIEVDLLQQTTSEESPSLKPTGSNQSDSLEDVPEDNVLGLDNGTSVAKGLFGAFARQASKAGAGTDFWTNFDSMRTPPPLFPRASSSAVSDDVNMDSPSGSTPPTSFFSSSIPQAQEQAKEDVIYSRSSTPQPTAPPSAAEGLKKASKRRRDDDLDVSSMKRRAVSPGMSVQNSPILSQSPGQRETGLWGHPPPKASREGSVMGNSNGERSNSNGSMSSTTPSLGPKRIGLQGMTDTHDGLMKMSIE